MHRTTIQGEPWKPCAECPRRKANGGDGSEGVCPSRRHIAFCKYASRAVAAIKSLHEATAHARARLADLAAGCTEVIRWAHWLDRIRSEPPEDRGAAEKPPRSPQGRSSAPSPPEVSPESPEAVVTRWEAIKRSKQCPHFEKDASCGCVTKGTCKLGRVPEGRTCYRGSDCVECVLEGGWERFEERRDAEGPDTAGGGAGAVRGAGDGGGPVGAADERAG